MKDFSEWLGEFNAYLETSFVSPLTVHRMAESIETSAQLEKFYAALDAASYRLGSKSTGLDDVVVKLKRGEWVTDYGFHHTDLGFWPRYYKGFLEQVGLFQSPIKKPIYDLEVGDIVEAQIGSALEEKWPLYIGKRKGTLDCVTCGARTKELDLLADPGFTGIYAMISGINEEGNRIDLSYIAFNPRKNITQKQEESHLTIHGDQVTGKWEMMSKRMGAARVVGKVDMVLDLARNAYLPPVEMVNGIIFQELPYNKDLKGFFLETVNCGSCSNHYSVVRQGQDVKFQFIPPQIIYSE
ncbi:MAG: hypothetical protein NDI94_06485 [Candidatus Woesearchaeota archaeon]|nr:hypothetical protein [Candidatus Woesearchaeota archaeon]